MNKSRYKIIKKDRPGNTMYQMYVLEDDYVIEKITSSNTDGYIASFYISNINVESISQAWSTRFSKTYTTSIDRDLSDEFWASRFYADNNVIQSLDGVSDTHLLDSRGDYHGTQYEKYVYDFDGVDSDIDTGIFPPSYNGEVEMFIKVTGAGTIFSNRHTSTNYFEVKAGAVSSALITVELKESPNTYTLSSTFINDGEWHKVNIRYTGTELYITIDDTLDSSLTSLTQITSNLQELIIGSRGNLSNYVTMQLSNFKWLSLAGELLIFYKCEEQSGTTAYDSSGYANHGTLVGGITHTAVRVLMLVNYTNLVGYTKVGSVIVPRDESDTAFDVLGNDLAKQGEVAYDIKFINSNCILAGATTEGQFNFDCTGLTIKRYEGTATPTLDTVNDKLTFGAGTIYNLVLSNDYHFPIAEGSGTTSYRAEDSTKTITWTNSSWTTQDEYHYNITTGFNIVSGVKVPYMINGAYTYPAVIGHNVAETELTMEVFREKLGENPIFYNQIDLSSNEIDYYDLGTNSAFTSFLTSQNLKTDIQTLSSSDPAYTFKRRLYELTIPVIPFSFIEQVFNEYIERVESDGGVVEAQDYVLETLTSLNN